MTGAIQSEFHVMYGYYVQSTLLNTDHTQMSNLIMSRFKIYDREMIMAYQSHSFRVYFRGVAKIRSALHFTNTVERITQLQISFTVYWYSLRDFCLKKLKIRNYFPLTKDLFLHERQFK
jgi:hypothetical protein